MLRYGDWMLLRRPLDSSLVPYRSIFCGATKPNRRTQLILAVTFSVIFNLVFLLTNWDRFLAPSVSGMFAEFACRLLQGQIPYRDFYVVVTPFYIFKTALIFKLFGANLATLRMIEIIYRCVTCAILVLWLAKIVRVPYALLGTISASVFLSSDTADSLTSYHEDALFWALLAGILLSCVDWQRKSDSKDRWLILLSGVCAAVCFFTKQTAGAGLTLASILALSGIFIRERGTFHAISRVGIYLCGWALPAASLFWWLKSNGAWSAFVASIFINGPSAKGAAQQIFTRILSPLFLGGPIFDLFVLVLALGLMFWIISTVNKASQLQHTAEKRSYLLLIALSGLGAIGVGHLGWKVIHHHELVVSFLSIYTIFGTFLGILALVIHYTLILSHRSFDETEKQRWLLVVVAFWLTYTMSWSWGEWPPMAFPALAILVSLAFEDLEVVKGSRAIRCSIAVAILASIVILAGKRIGTPFTWEQWTDAPVPSAVAASSQPFLKGIYMPSEVASFTDELTGLIQKYSKSGEPIFIDSYQPLWYVLAERWPPTYAQVHFADVTPDDICRSDALRIVKAKPPVIVDFVTDADIQRGEIQFRGGRQSGQRELRAKMYELISTSYRLEKVFNIPEYGSPVKVFVLRDRH